MSKNKNIDTEEYRMVALHSPEGKPLYLRREFIIAAIASGENRGNHTVVSVDEGNQIAQFEVRESLKDIRGPFADLGWLKLNPAYFAGVTPRPGTEDYSDIRLHSPANYYFYTNNDSAEEIVTAVQEARSLGPC